MQTRLRRWRAASSFICIWLGMQAQSLTALAAGASGGTYNFDWLKTENNGTLDSLTETAKQTGGSLYQLLMAVGVIGLFTSIIVIGVNLAIGRNANKRSENISHLLYIALAGVLIFGAMSIISYFQSIGGNL